MTVAANVIPFQRLGQPAMDIAEADPGDRLMWSVTTLIDVLDRPALMYWSAEQAALAAVHSESTWRGMLADDDPDCRHESAEACAVIKWLRDARYRKPKGIRSATDLGTDVHTAIESYALTGTKPEVDAEVQPFLDRFDEWAQQFSPSYQATEVAVFHPDFAYAGTADAFLTINGVRFIADYKSTRKIVDSRGQPTKPYPETVGLQLAAYRNAKFAAVWRARRLERMRRRYYALSAAEMSMAVPVPEVDTGLVIHISPAACEAYPIECGPDVFEAFLAAQDAARWVQQTSKRVMGQPLVPVTER